MRLWKGLLVGMVAAGLAGCTNSGSTPPSAGGSSSAAGTATRVAVPVTTPLPAGAKDGVRAAAARFERVYFASRIADSWNLLAPDARRQVPENVWVRVHDGCPAATSGVTRVIKSVTVFGDTAIVTETILRGQSRRGIAEYVFDYIDGYWGYSPVYPGIYHRGSIAADIAAAKAEGLCGSWKAF